MANWIHTTTLKHLTSVSPNALPEARVNYIKDPDMTNVLGVPHKYWKLVGSIPTEMTQPEKDVVDAAQAQAEEDSEIDVMDFGTLKRFALILLDEINILRVNDSEAPRTMEQLKTAMRSK